MAKKIWYVGSGIAVLGLAFIGGSYFVGSNPTQIGSAFLNIFLGAGEPDSAIEVELRQAAQTAPSDYAAMLPATGNAGDWTSYNRTVKGERFAPADQITADNAGNLKVLCTYDTGKLEGNQTGILMVNGAVIGTTAAETFSIDANTCKENWRTNSHSGVGPFPVNRGAAYMDGKLFRAFADGYVRAFEASNGKELWKTFVGDKNLPVWFNSAPQAYDGLVFFGIAGGDQRDVRGRMHALNAETGEPVWQTFVVPPQPSDPVLGKLGKMPLDDMKRSWGNAANVPISGGGMWTTYTIDPKAGYLYIPVGNPAPDFVKTLRPGANRMTNTLLVLDMKTGDYVKHYQIMPDDWHDWDMSNAPTLYTSRGGRQLASFSPKDGHLYTYDTSSDEQVYRKPVTTMLNTDVTFEPGKDVHFCPGSVGGGEWNGTAYDPQHNLLFTGENDWCATTTIAEEESVASGLGKVKDEVGMQWFGVPYLNPHDLAGKLDPKEKWGGWLYATDADTGEWAWRVHGNFPILSGVTPTAGGIVMFGDVGGGFYVLRASDGKQLWRHAFDGGISGGVISYTVGDKQRIALTSGMAHPAWPVPPGTAKVQILGLE